MHEAGLDKPPIAMRPSEFVERVMSVNEVRNTNLMRVTITYTDPVLAAKMANDLARHAVEVARNVSAEEAKNSRNMIKQQVDLAKRLAPAELVLRYVEVDGSWQAAGPLRFRAIEVDHVPHLRCFGYLLERGHRTIAYAGDTQPCAGLDELVGASDTAVLECNGRHPEPTHMDLDAIRALRARFPAVPFVLTHVGPDVDASGIGDAVLPDDFETLNL